MSKTLNFPGMNPYLESSVYWLEIHTWLIVEIARNLNPQLQPKYCAAVETRVYVDEPPTVALVDILDATLYQKDKPTSEQADLSANESSVATVTKPKRVTLPMPYEVTERYLETKDLASKQVVAVLELLSPANKRPGEGLRKYL